MAVNSYIVEVISAGRMNITFRDPRNSGSKKIEIFVRCEPQPKKGDKVSVNYFQQEWYFNGSISKKRAA